MMSSDRWVEVTASQFPWEERALAWIRERLPDRSPFMAWSNFEFLALDGGFLEIDLLVFSKSGVFLVEIKSYEGSLDIGPRTWVHTTPNGQRRALENPFRLADFKARKLRELLERVSPVGVHAPFVEAVVFLSESDLETTIRAPGENHVLFTGENGRPALMDALVDGSGPGLRGSKYPLDRPLMKRFRQAMIDAEVEPTRKHKRIGDWKLGELFAAGPRFQDLEAKHVSNGTERWARWFFNPKDASKEEAERLSEAARREFTLLDGLRHPGILEVKQHIADPRRPALLFEKPKDAVRLDHLLRSDQGLSAADRFDILRRVAEAVDYAHRKRVFHRALSPESVLVLAPETDGRRGVRVFNWHTATKADEETGTRHVDAYLGHEATIYLAPEVLVNPELANESADVFGLGALAFLLFTNEAPARDIAELSQTLREERGLRPSSVADGVDPELDDLVWRATHPQPSQRLASVDDFLFRLEVARAAMFPEEERELTDPLDAEAKDFFDGRRFEVVRRLGRGATSVALLVRTEDGKPRALKIASSDLHHERLEAEARALQQFDHPRIVHLHEVIDLGSRRALVLDYAGETLRNRLRERSALSLDDQRRYGQDLCEILVALEQTGVLHRDIKPANLGIATPDRAAPRLVIFDFSLAGAKLESIDVGTPVYRDPFLVTRSQWDEWADRWSAAVTLHEIVTGKLPQWGDGLTNPAFDDDAALDLRTESFPAAVREPLERFFHRALARDVSQRFSSAHDMLDGWLGIFETTVGPEDLPDLRSVTLETRVNTLGVGDLAVEALDRLDVFTVADFLGLSPQGIQFQDGTSGAVRKKLRRVRTELEALFPESDAVVEEGERDWGRLAIEDVLAYVAGPQSKEPVPTRDFVRQILGLDGGAVWEPRDVLAARLGLDAEEMWERVRSLRESWARKPSIRPLREDVIHIVQRAEGAVAVDELAESVLAYRGSLEDDADERLLIAAAAARVGVEAELASNDSRLRLRRVGRSTFVATDDELLDVLEPLGIVADELACSPTLRSPRAAYEALTSVLERADMPSMSDHRLLSLAAAASSGAALSARLEIYPIGMDASRSLALTAGAFGKIREISREELDRHVHARYPEATPLPEPLQLEALLDELDLGLRWDATASGGAGAFVSERPPGIGSASTRWSTSTVSLSKHELERQAFEERLRYAMDKGGFMAVLVNPKYAEVAADRLQELGDFDRVSLDRMFVEAMHDKADPLDIWNLVLAADAPDADAESRREFGYFLEGVVAGIQSRLAGSARDLLIEHAGLIGRWDAEHGTMRVIEALRDAAGNPGGPRIAWLVLSADEQNPMPTIDGVAVPIIDPSENVRVPRAWLRQTIAE